jgi:hypothetical protein
VVAVVAGLLGLSAAELSGSASAIDLAAPTTYQVVTLTSTLNLTSGAILRDTHYIWKGPSNQPMLLLNGAQFVSIEHLFLEVTTGYHATAGIQLANSPSGGPLGEHLSDIRIGNYGVAGNFDYGILWTGTGNGDSNTLTNVFVFGAGVAAVSLSNNQATANSLRGIYSFYSPIGIHSQAGVTIECLNCGFIGSTDVDIELTNGGGLLLTGMYSEGSRSFARVVAGPGAGGLSVQGGYWQWSSTASGATITGQMTGSYRSWLRLSDFMVTPLDGTNHGTTSGFSPSIEFFSNTAGITP